MNESLPLPANFIAHTPPFDDSEWRALTDLYSHGACHVLAIAAAELWADMFSGFLVIENPFEICWENPRDPDDTLPFVVHVYAIFRTPTGEMALDIFGIRAKDMARIEAGRRYSVGSDAQEEEVSLDFLFEQYIDHDDPEDPAAGFRPLRPIGDGEVAAARGLLAKIVPNGLT